ncbi:MAG: FecR domain-containing protein [Halioglobus sp.]
MNRNDTSSQDRLRDTALSWIARLRSDVVTDADKGNFALWLAEEDSHARAMDEMLDMWDDLACIKQMPIEVNRPDPAANQGGWLAASMAIAASFALAFFLWPASTSTDPTVLFETAIGERNTYTLDDNSIVTLNTNSKIRVRYSEDARMIDLVRGEAFFEVAKNPERPFEVDAGAAKVTALGTAFNIFRTKIGADITVTEGVIRVTELGNTGNRAPEIKVLQVNEYLQATERGLESSGTVDTADLIAWQSGKLIAKEMTLRDLIDELARYRKTRIIISDREIAAFTISGVFELDQPQSTLSAVALSLGLQVVELDENTMQLLKTSH